MFIQSHNNNNISHINNNILHPTKIIHINIRILLVIIKIHIMIIGYHIIMKILLCINLYLKISRVFHNKLVSVCQPNKLKIIHKIFHNMIKIWFKDKLDI